MHIQLRNCRPCPLAIAMRHETVLYGNKGAVAWQGTPEQHPRAPRIARGPYTGQAAEGAPAPSSLGLYGPGALRWVDSSWKATHHQIGNGHIHMQVPFLFEAKTGAKTARGCLTIICVSMIDSVCPWTYSSGGPTKTLACCCCRCSSPQHATWVKTCFGEVWYSTSSELTTTPRRVTTTPRRVTC